MARWLKRIVLGVFAVVALLVVTGVALTFLLDPNDYKDDIEVLVEEQTGREFRIEGDIRLSLFPWVGVEVGRVTLADEEPDADPFIEVDGVRAAVRVLPLLRGQVETEVFAVEQPRMRLVRYEDGTGNWESLQERLAQDAPPAEEAERDPTRDDAELPEAVREAVIGGVRVRNAAVLWEDRGTGERIEADPLNLDIQTIRLGQPIPVRGDGRIRGSEIPDISAELHTRVTVSNPLDEIAVEAMEASVEADGPGVPGYRQTAALEGHGTVGLDGVVTLDWPELRLSGAGVMLESTLEATLGDPIEVDADWEVDPFNLKATLGLLDLDPPRTTDTSALTGVGASGRVQVRGEEVGLEEFEAQLDHFTVTGEASLRGFDAPSIAFDLELDRIELDAYMPPEDREAAAADPTRQTEGLPDLEAIELDPPLEVLRELDIEGTLRAGEIGFMNLSLEDLAFDAYADGGRLGVRDASADLYEGALRGEAELDARGDYPFVDLDLSLEGTRFAPLLEDFFERDSAYLDGLGAFRLRGQGGGPNVHALIESFDGDGEIEVEDGAVLGVHLPYEIARAAAVLGRGDTPDEPTGEDVRTVFASLSATFRFADGIVRNNDLRADAPALRVRGEGEVDILGEQIDYLLRSTVTGELKDGEGRVLEAIRGVTVPVRVTGNLFDPSIRPDLADALGEERMRQLRGLREDVEETQERLREEIDERRDEGRERLREEAEDRIRQFLR